MNARCFRTSINFVHHIAARSELVDNACVQDHTHANAEIIVEVEVKEWIDFKIIKEITLEAIDRMFLSEEHNVIKDGITYRNIGQLDSEGFVKEIKRLIRVALVVRDYHNIKVHLRIWETSKYGYYSTDENAVNRIAKNK